MLPEPDTAADAEARYRPAAALAPMDEERYRMERDALGEPSAAADAPWGAETRRTLQTFAISGVTTPAESARGLAPEGPRRLPDPARLARGGAPGARGR